MTKAEQFEQFWRLYPRRVGKGAARKSFERALKLASFEEIMEGLRRQLQYYATREHQFIPHPATWINQERWGDDPQPWMQKGKSFRDERNPMPLKTSANYGPAEVVSPPEPISPEEAERRRQMVAKLRAEGVIGRTMQ